MTSSGPSETTSSEQNTMEDHDPQPDPTPARTADAPSESDSTEDQSVAQYTALPLSRRGALVSLLGIGAVSLGLSSPASAKQPTAGRYLARNQGTLDFTGQAEWGNPGRFLNNATGRFATVGGGDQNEASGPNATVGGGFNNTANDLNATVAGGQSNSASGDHATVAGGGSNESSDEAATVGGGFRNRAEAQGATIGGGGDSTGEEVGGRNIVFDDFGTIGGGDRNRAGTNDENKGNAKYATVGGGFLNNAVGPNATIPGGRDNTAGGASATVGGGIANDALGVNATVPGGANNRAIRSYSFAAGRRARADAKGAFVWGDGSDQNVKSTVQDEFKVQAGGGAIIYSSSDLSTGVNLAPGSGSWSSVSTRTAKSNVRPVEPREMLDRVTELVVSRWEYDTQSGVDHVGPMAEDFSEAFALGGDDETIATVDADGVAFAAIQGLSAKLGEKGDRIDDLEAEIEDLTREVESLRAENEQLRERLSGVEDRLASLEAG